MKLRISGRLEPLANVVGMGAWAGSQLLLMVAIASALSLDVVGVFSLGLTVFSLLMVALGLNMRLAIAVDREDRIAVLPALAIRFVTALGVFAAALATMSVYAPSSAAFLFGAVLLSGRISDQLVDIFYGFQQQQGRSLMVSASFFLRGMMTCLLSVGLFLWRSPPQAFVLAGTVTYCLVSILFEIALFRGRWRPVAGGRFLSSVTEVLQDERIRSVSTFPMFDALHFSSFRLAVAPVLDPRSFGLFALAMNVFSAVQVAITALGLTALARLKSGAYERAGDPVKSMLRDAFVQGAVCVALFGLGSLVFAGLGGAKSDDPQMLDLFLVGNFLALLLFPFTAFIAQGSVFFGDRAGYWQAPLMGSVAFGLAAACLAALGHRLQWHSTNAYMMLCGALFVSSLLRISVSLYRLRTPLPADV